MDGKDYGVTVRLATEDNDRFTKLAKRYDLHKSEVIGLLGELCEKHDLLRKDWQKSINALVERGRKAVELNEWDGMEDAPQEIQYAKETFKYVERTKAGKIKLTSLSPVWKEALGIVREFQRQEKESMEKTQLKKIIGEQDQQIKGLESRGYKIPMCDGGAALTPDGTGFKRCRKSNIDVDIARFCKVIENGPCSYFREIGGEDLMTGDFQTIRIRKCNLGASLTAKGKNFKNCPQPQAQGKGEILISGFCMIYQNGGPCQSLAFTELPYSAYEIVEQQLKKKGKKHTNNR